jgi:serine/threonine-protein kinase
MFLACLYFLFNRKYQKNKKLTQNKISEPEEVGRVIVPNLVGMNFKEEIKLVSNYNLVMISEEFNEKIPKGSIISQTPVSGTLVLPGFTVAAKVSKGSEIKILPEISGKTLADAVYELSLLSLVPIEIRQPNNLPEGIVLGYKYKRTGESVRYGEKIFIITSSG